MAPFAAELSGDLEQQVSVITREIFLNHFCDILLTGDAISVTLLVVNRNNCTTEKSTQEPFKYMELK